MVLIIFKKLPFQRISSEKPPFNTLLFPPRNHNRKHFFLRTTEKRAGAIETAHHILINSWRSVILNNAFPVLFLALLLLQQ